MTSTSEELIHFQNICRIDAKNTSRLLLYLHWLTPMSSLFPPAPLHDHHLHHYCWLLLSPPASMSHRCLFSSSPPVQASLPSFFRNLTSFSCLSLLSLHFFRRQVLTLLSSLCQDRYAEDYEEYMNEEMKHWTVSNDDLRELKLGGGSNGMLLGNFSKRYSRVENLHQVSKGLYLFNFVTDTKGY
jgi:hypothetical protein